MTKAENDKKKAVIQSLVIGIQLVDLIVKNGQPMKLNDIYHSTGITKSNLYKYLNTLTQLGLLYRDQDSGHYHLGCRLIEYGMAAIDRENLIDRIVPHLQEINNHCQETVLLHMWTNQGPVVVKMFSSHQDLNIGARIGTLLPLRSAAGKIFAAFFDEVMLRNWKEREWSKLTSKEQQELANELEQVRKAHVSFAKEPLVPFISSLGFPIFNYEQKLMACFTVVGFSQDIPHDVSHPLCDYLMEKSREISRVCGWRGSS